MKKICLLLLIMGVMLRAQQINIPRVEQMPNLPQPYEMRNWKQVTMGYDSLVFDLTKTGTYLPLVWINTNTVNYSTHNSFGLHTVVGTPYPSNAEGINVLPAVISASLVGIDKSDQDGHNWVLGCEEWFNKRPAENVYLNNYVSSSGDDFWYHTMPNVFFYQLYNFYPETGDFQYQFTSVANQWLTAVKTMGGKTAPWSKAYMNYRGWYLSTMTPYTSGVKEPEAAGAIAWLLYNAYLETGEAQYRQGAEWAMEFLSAFSTNASYELQLPYGVYAAARMNAELNTDYDIEKIVNWCFTPDGNVRGWGVTLGTWGDYDCYGLVGEAVDKGYAFAMNGYEMAGALVPMVRYDDRFARAIAKWVLNMANASRLYYSPFLPDSLQDGEAWAKVYDPHGYIAHESMREVEPNWQVSPFATGDAIAGNWGATNFALYGSSHVGILGGIIDTTNVMGILQLDVCKTDYFQDNSFQTYLYYNPYDVEKTITINVGTTSVDCYDLLTNQYLLTGVSGETSLTISADAAVMIALVPAGGTVTYNEARLLVDGIVVDYNSGQTVDNYKPRIKALACESDTITTNQQVNIYCTATDPDGNTLNYSWKINQENIARDSTILIWTAPGTDTVVTIYCIVNDGMDTVTDSVKITVLSVINVAPEINEIYAESYRLMPGDTTTVTCSANDANGDILIFAWSAKTGEFFGTADSVVKWIAPTETGSYCLSCQVSDPLGAMAADSVWIVVRDTTGGSVGSPVAYYSFNGNASDQSGFENNGTVNGATLTSDRFGNANSAYYFNGSSDYIHVKVSESLNFSNAITVCFWLNAAEIFSNRESHPISHGSWENRWKFSIDSQGYVRFTVKTEVGVKDLDTKTKISIGTWYHVIGLYDGSNYEIYLNGELNNSTTFSGAIATTTIDMTIGQVLPNNNSYNFKGSIDDVYIYDYALNEDEINELYGAGSAFVNPCENAIPENYALMQNYPNPFNPATTILYQLPEAGLVTLQVFDLSGRLVETLVNKSQSAGIYQVLWNSQNVSSGIYFYKILANDFCQVKKCVRLK